MSNVDKGNKREYLYIDAYEGLLKLLMVIIPVSVGWFYNYIDNNFQSFIISFIISMVNQIYSARTSYKDMRIESARIKAENIIIILVVSCSLIYTLYIWIPSMNSDLSLSTEEFKVPVGLFIVSLLPNVFETLLTFFGKDLRLDKKFRRGKGKIEPEIDLTCAYIN